MPHSLRQREDWRSYAWASASLYKFPLCSCWGFSALLSSGVCSDLPPPGGSGGFRVTLTGSFLGKVKIRTMVVTAGKSVPEGGVLSVSLVSPGLPGKALYFSGQGLQDSFLCPLLPSYAKVQGEQAPWSSGWNRKWCGCAGGFQYGSRAPSLVPSVSFAGCLDQCVHEDSGCLNTMGRHRVISDPRVVARATGDAGGQGLLASFQGET